MGILGYEKCKITVEHEYHALVIHVVQSMLYFQNRQAQNAEKWPNSGFRETWIVLKYDCALCGLWKAMNAPNHC